MKNCCLLLAALVVLVAVVFHETLVEMKGHALTAYNGFQALRTMPKEDIDNFFKAYELIETIGADDRPGIKNEAELKAIHDYYKVLHQILSVGVVMEIMLMPPILDPSVGVLKNMDLWMQRMIDFVNVKPGEKVLDMGSGRGKIAQKVYQATGAKVVQINIDETQIAFAQNLAKQAGNEEFMEFHIQDYNLPFPYIEDGSIDAQYCAQSCAFLSNKTKHLNEMYRVLKPGGMVYHLEWLAKDSSDNKSSVANYDKTNATHRELLRKTGVVVGGTMPSGIREWEEAFKATGFELLASREPAQVPSIVLLHETNKMYEPLTGVLVWLSDIGILSTRFKDLFLRLRHYWDAAVEAHKLELCSLTYEFVARKPL